MAQSVNPSLSTANLAFCADPAPAPRRPSSVKDAADQIAALNSKDYTTYSSGGKTHYVWTFLSTETFNTSRWSLLVDAFVVGGGGSGYDGGSPAGGVTHNGGGGAGGVAYTTGFLLPAGVNTFTVGGGSAATVVGGDSSILTNQYGGNTLVGKGGGSAGPTNDNGGSGGGGYYAQNGGDENQSSENGVLTSGFVTNFGYDGGDSGGGAGQYAAGGGGGAGAVGYNGSSSAVANNSYGGVGIQEGVDFYINGTSNWYAGGGGGTCGTCAAGGTGGGGQGGNWSACDSQSGTANTGGGGGGHDNRGSGAQNYAGGSGIIIIRLTDDPGSISESVLYDLASGDSGQMYCGSCVDFDGTDAYVTYGDVEWLDGLTTISVCCWLNQDGAPPNSGGVFLSKDNAIECWTKQSSTNQFVLSINNNHIILTGGGVPPIGEWFHVVMTWNSIGDERRLYLNGVLVDENDGGTQSGNSINNTADGLAIGARANGTYEIDGKISDTKIFAKELSAANVKELYENSKVIIPTKQDPSGEFLSQGDLLLWAPLAEGFGYVAYDGSGHGRHGTYSATDWLTGQSGCPQLITGYNKPMWFSNAGSDYVQVASDGRDTFANQSYTVAGWLYVPDGAGFGGERVIFSYDYTSHGTPYYAIQIRLDSGGGIFFAWNDGSQYRHVGAAGAFGYDNRWYHLACTYTSGAQKIYIDGVQVAQDTRTDTITFYDQEVWIGRATFGGYWDGLINELAVYDKALPASEIKALASRVTIGGSLNSVSLLNNANYPMTWVSGASVTGITAKSDAASSLDAFNTTDSLVFVTGQRYRASFRAEQISGSLPTFSIVDQVNWSVTKTGFGTLATVTGYNSKEWVSTQSGTFVAVWYTQSTAGVFNISDFSIVPVGEPSPPDAMVMGNEVAEAVSAKSSDAAESTYSYGGTTYKTWTYRSGGTFVVPRDMEVDVVIVGGGGGGGWNVGGGGGAGGLVSETLVAAPGKYTVIVGAGGVGRYNGMSPAECTSGGDSSVDFAANSRVWPFAAITTTAVGGGRGGGYITSWSDAPESGGSGGGGRHGQGGASGTGGQGNAGGTGTYGTSNGSTKYCGAGGGGAGAVGANATYSSVEFYGTAHGGNGGNGKNDFINSSVAETAALLAAALPTVGGGYLAGGGGGSKQGGGGSTVGEGGKGGGGKGANYATRDGEAGQVNTGGGGGAEMDGGSGVVIIRYAVPTPIGYWRNDGTSAWTDLSGNANNGTIYGSPASLLLKQGYSASKSTNAGRDNQGFPLKQKDVGAVGFANYIANATTTGVPIGDTIVTSGGLNVGTSGGAGTFAISAWANPEILGTGVSRSIIKKRTQNGHWPAWELYVTSGGALVGSYSSTTYGQCLEAYTTADGTIQENNWYNIVFVKPAGDYQVVKVYINGVNVDAPNTLDYGSHTTSTSVATSTQPAYIGRDLDGDNSTGTWRNPWVGQLGPIQVYTEALTSAQVKQNFEAQANRFQANRGIIQSGLVLHLDAGNTASYPGSGTTWADLSGNANTAILSGGAAYSSVNGGVIDFDGVDGKAHVSSLIPNITGSYTITQWVKRNGTGYEFLWEGNVGASKPAIENNIFYHNNSNRGAVAVSTTAWTHVVAMFDGSYTTTYVNGVRVIHSAYTTANPTVTNFTIAARNSTTAYNLDGLVGEVCVYNRALSAGEVEHNFELMRDRFET